MTIDQSLIDEIVQRIVDVAHPDRIVLFGSAARGAMTHDSDIDLLIVKDDPGDRLTEYVRIRRSLRGLERPFDIILISTAWYEETKDVIGGVAYPAHKHGRTIYEAA